LEEDGGKEDDVDNPYQYHVEEPEEKEYHEEEY